MAVSLNRRGHEDAYIQVMRALFDAGSEISRGDATRIIRNASGISAFSPAEVSDALAGAGFKPLSNTATDAQLWRLWLIPVMVTDDPDPIRAGGGVVVYDLDEGTFHWSWWPDPHGMVSRRPYHVHDFVFRMDELEEDFDFDLDHIRSAYATAVDLRRMLASADFIDRMELLEIVRDEDYEYLDDDPEDFRLAEVVQAFGIAIDVARHRTVDKVRAIARQLLSAGTASSSRDPSAEDLALINRHRRSLGMQPLDPVAAGWTAEDVRIEADALRARGINPADPSSPRRPLLAW